MSKNKQDLGPYRRKQFQTYFQFSLIAICFVIIFVLFYACTGSNKNDIDYTDAKVIQMDEPAVCPLGDFCPSAGAVTDSL